MAKKYRVFISHAWRYGDYYDRLIRLLENRPYFYFIDYSIPKSRPVDTSTDRELREVIRNKMKPCQVVLVMAGVYATHRRWIRAEVDMAATGFQKPKPIIAVTPSGAQRISDYVRQNADRVVKWNTEAIVAAIRELSI